MANVSTEFVFVRPNGEAIPVKSLYASQPVERMGSVKTTIRVYATPDGAGRAVRLLFVLETIVGTVERALRHRIRVHATWDGRARLVIFK